MIRILIVDDQNLVREGIKILLEKATEIKIVDDASDGNSALEKIATLQPDIVLLDINMPGVDGLAVADQIRHQFPQVKIIMLSSHDDESYVRKSTQLGAKGYLLKSASSQELEWSIKLVHQGYSTLKSELLDGQLFNDHLPNNHPPNTVESIPANTVEAKPSKKPEIIPPNKNETVSKPPQDFVVAKKEISQSRPNSHNNSHNNFHNDNSHSQNLAAAILSEREQANLDQLEFLLAKNHVQQKYSSYRQQKRKNPLFHDVRISQIKKTMTSFEFKLLVFIILFSLGFLVFLTLSSNS
jgi:YesN/AraC family two-component response regulator